MSFDDSLRLAQAACPPALLRPLQGARLLVTGATGFFGHWVLRAVSRLNAQGFGMRLQCVSRDPAGFLRREPEIAAQPHDWLQADAAGFARLSPDPGTTHILHMAASTDAARNLTDPWSACLDILDGARGCVDLARRTGAHLHLVSSGAVYGARRQGDGPAGEDDVPRSAPHPLDAAQAYGNAKRMAESLVAAGAPDHAISRPFAFLGPRLPLDRHFAAGNFVADAVAGRSPLVRGDGRPLRSYMHPADLAFWLLALLGGAPRGRAFNVGSDAPVSIADLAREIAAAAGAPAPRVLQAGRDDADPPAYWPDTSAARAMGLRCAIARAEAVADTVRWARGLSSLPSSDPS